MHTLIQACISGIKPGVLLSLAYRNLVRFVGGCKIYMHQGNRSIALFFLSLDLGIGFVVISVPFLSILWNKLGTVGIRSSL